MKNEFNLITIILVLFIFSSSLCIEISDMYYNSSINNNICASKDYGCSFNVTYNYPISPLVPTSYPTQAILGNYRYIYLRFTIPESQKQKSFYLEAYYISDEETIISNGDCYYINTLENIDYELRIDKTLRIKSYIRFGFFGIPSDFNMEIKLHFILNVHLYFNDIALSNANSLKRKDIDSLKKYLEEKDKKIIEQKKREKIAQEFCSNIMKNLFDVDLDVNSFEGDSFYSSVITAVSPFIVTKVSYAVGLVIAIENFLHPESIILSETTIKDGKIVDYKDGLDYLEGNALINNDVLKMIESYNKRITDMYMNFGINRDYSIIVSTNKDINYILYTIRVYIGKDNQIYCELIFKTQLTNIKINELIVNSPELPEIFAFIPFIEQCFSENALTIKSKIQYIMKGVYLISGIFDLSKNNQVSPMNKASLLIKETDWAKVVGTILEMDADENGVYHARFDCWQYVLDILNFTIYFLIYLLILDIATMECLDIIMKIIFYGLGKAIILILEQEQNSAFIMVVRMKILSGK